MLQTCKNTKCGKTFRATESWHEYCPDCWKDVYRKTVPESESKHPALKYEREHQAEKTKKASPQVANAELAKVKALLRDVAAQDEPVEGPFVSQFFCNHEMDKPRCGRCGAWAHQIEDQIQFALDHPA